MGAEVDEVTAYRTIAVSDHDASVMERIQNAEIDMVTFTSSSTVTNFCDLYSNAIKDDKFQKNVVMASIGPVTSDTAQKKGLNISVEAESFTIPGLVEAICDYYDE